MKRSPEQQEFVPMVPSEILNALPVQPGATILCVGTESAAFVPPMVECVGHAGHIFLLNMPETILSEIKLANSTREIVSMVSFQEEGELSLPLSADSIDWVFMVHSLHRFYFKGMLPALFKEIRRIHKPDGKLVVIESEPPAQASGPSVQLRIPSTQMNSIVYPNGYFLFEAMPLENNMYLGFYKRQPHYEIPDDDDLGN